MSMLSTAMVERRIRGTAGAYTCRDLRVERNTFTDMADFYSAEQRIIEAFEYALDFENVNCICALSSRPEEYGDSGENFKFTLQDSYGSQVFCDYRNCGTRIYLTAESEGESEGALTVSINGGAFYGRVMRFFCGEAPAFIA